MFVCGASPVIVFLLGLHDCKKKRFHSLDFVNISVKWGNKVVWLVFPLGLNLLYTSKSKMLVKVILLRKVSS